MWELANRLMIAGDIDRAFRLINYASQCAKMFGSRQRLTLITPILNDIAAQYKEKSQRNFRQLMLAVGFLSNTGLTEWIAQWSMTREFTKGKPWLLMTVIFLCAIVGLLC